MRNSLQKRLFKEGWTVKELSDFLKKHGVERKKGTILNDIKNGERFFVIKKIGGYVILPDNTVKSYIEFIFRTKKRKKVDGRLVDLDELIGDISAETKEQLSEKRRNEENEKDVFRGEIIDYSGSTEDRIIEQKGAIKMIRRV